MIDTSNVDWSWAIASLTLIVGVAIGYGWFQRRKFHPHGVQYRMTSFNVLNGDYSTRWIIVEPEITIAANGDAGWMAYDPKFDEFYFVNEQGHTFSLSDANLDAGFIVASKYIGVVGAIAARDMVAEDLMAEAGNDS